MYTSTDLEKQIEFIREIDKLKNIFRLTYLMDASRHENDAEHSWHLSVMVFLLKDYANEEFDVQKVLQMVLIHDVVEIIVGDVNVYDLEARKKQEQKEQDAAVDIFGKLPKEQGNEFLTVWREFEEGLTTESKFAKALDRMQPVLHNFFTEGKAWKEHNIKASQVIAGNKHIEKGSKELWKFIRNLIDTAIERNYLINDLDEVNE